MSVYGPTFSVLHLYGCSSRPVGTFWQKIMIPLSFYLQVAGPVPLVFAPPSPLQFCQGRNPNIQIAVYALDQLANPLNISAASAMQINFRQPSGGNFYRTASFVTNGYDGGFFYNSLITDFIQDGEWMVQGQFTVSGQTMTTQLGKFLVESNVMTL